MFPSLVLQELFQWLWPQIIQRHLNTFIQFWEYSRYHAPEGDDAHETISDLGVSVDVETVEHLRQEFDIARDDAMRLVDDVFKALAEETYSTIGQPNLSLTDGWAIFREMRGTMHVKWLFYLQRLNTMPSGSRAGTS